MKKFQPDRLAQWEKTRARGKSRFIWTHGILQWGGFMFFFSMAVFQHRHYGDVFSTEGNLPFRLILALLVWVFVGHLYGQSRWRRNEQEYQAQKASKDSTSA
ncbi:MAG: hypothetical protein PHE55_06175 [Methylococcaceae bacterium]|nr:hypothetical protein [Methylococcaceae bacterium]